LLGGDLAYADNVDATRWVDFFQSWMIHVRGKQGRLIPMVVAIGNHEVEDGYDGRPEVEALQFYTLFDLPSGKARYALDFGKYLSLVVLDSEHTEEIAGGQADWLGAVLAARAEQTFLFPCYHFPAYGTAKGPGEGKLPIEHPRAIAIRTHWVPQFERYGVSAIFENDHHNFKRTHRLRGHKRDDENGLLYLGDGAWGVRTRTVPPLSEAWYLAKAEPVRHLFHVVLQPTGQALISAVNDKGDVFDRVELLTPRTRPVAP
jgi:acid phosphatase type 7